MLDDCLKVSLFVSWCHSNQEINFYFKHLNCQQLSFETLAQVKQTQ